MDGKVLILCDEMPGDYEHYSVKDSRFLVGNMIDPDDDPEKIFLCWDSVIPEDRTFIEACKHYAKFTEKPDPKFAVSKRGSIDPKTGNIKTSIQEESYMNTYQSNLQYLSNVGKKGGDITAEAMELAVQYTYDANQRFFEDFSRLLEQNQVVRILPSYSVQTHSPTTQYRMQMLEAWKNANKFMRENKSCAKVVEPIVYTKNKDDENSEYPDFGEVYKKAGDQLLEIYSLPIFGESDDEQEL